MKKVIFLLVILSFLMISSVISAPVSSAPVADSQPATATADTVVQNDNDIVKVGQDITIKAGETVRNATTVRGDITISGHVTESVIAVLGNVHIMSGGVVDGDVFTIRGKIEKEPGAVIHGKQSVSGSIKKKEPHSAFPFIILFLLSVLVVVLVTVFFPQRMTMISNVLNRNLGGSWFVGMLASFLVTPIAIILFVTCIAIPIIIVEILFVIILWILGKVAVDLALGKRLSALVNRPIASVIVAALLGEIVITAISLLPFLGCVIVYLVSIAGFGAVISTGFGKDERWLDRYIRKWLRQPAVIDTPNDELSNTSSKS